jgi:vacuolar-type H+-ATPase subunit D/Vma8
MRNKMKILNKIAELLKVKEENILDTIRKIRKEINEKKIK